MRSAATGSELHKFDVRSKQQSFEKTHHLQQLSTATPDVHGGSAQIARHGVNMDHLVENKT